MNKQILQFANFFTEVVENINSNNHKDDESDHSSKNEDEQPTAVRKFTIDDIIESTEKEDSAKQNKAESDNKNLFSGHRERARERFMQNEVASIADYDLLELLLFLIKPRVDVKPEAKKMIDHFKNIRNIANATENKLSTFISNPRYIKYIFKLCSAVHTRVIYNNLHKSIILNHWESMIEYIRSVLCNKDQECFMVFYLNGKYQLITEKILAYGDIDKVVINPKDVIKDAINYNSKIIIIAHNHPSGLNEPSNNDIEITDIIANIASSMDIILLDHIIITNNNYFSFREGNLL